MTHERMVSRYLLIFLTILSLAFIAPVSAAGGGPRVVQPGEMIEVGHEAIVLDLVNLRNPDTFNPITSLRRYKDDNPAKRVERVVGVPDDRYFRFNDRTFDGKYGRYFVYSDKDGLLKDILIFSPAPVSTPTPVVTPTEIPTEVPTEVPTGTPTEAVTPNTATEAPPAGSQVPLSGLIALMAIGISGALIAMRKR